MTELTVPRKILIADDSALVAKVLSDVLRKHGYSVVTAANGIEAAQAVYSEQPDLIVLDIFMPRMNGYQVCRLLKNDPLVSHIPVVINTASDSRSTEFWSLHTGADAFMMKGATSAELLDKVGGLLQNHVAPPLPQSPLRPGPEEILSKLCALSDQELYSTTVKSMQWKTILENLSEGILLVDMERRVSSANHFLCGLLGVLEVDILGKPLEAGLGDAAGAATLQLIERALDKNQEPTCDSEIHGHPGKVTPVSISVALVHDYLGEVVGFVCLFQDITRRKQIESLNQLKNDLTDMIVHDLRTPLTSLLTGMQTVALLGEMNEDQKEFMGISIEGGQILLGMINDLLDISKMEDGSLKLELKELEVAAVLSRATRQVSSLAEAKGLQLLCDVPAGLPAVQGDEDKLLRTLVNLLSNAIKFTPDGGTITVTAQLIPLALRRTLGEGVLLTVQDTGEGIPREAFERVFEKFGQVETRKAGRKMSSGLGLTFCKMVVEAHGGRIWVESEVGQGATFFLSIPAPHHVSDTQSEK